MATPTEPTDRLPTGQPNEQPSEQPAEQPSEQPAQQQPSEQQAAQQQPAQQQPAQQQPAQQQPAQQQPAQQQPSEQQPAQQQPSEQQPALQQPAQQQPSEQQPTEQQPAQQQAAQQQLSDQPSGQPAQQPATTGRQRSKATRNWFIGGAIGLFVVLLCCAGVVVGGLVLLDRETPERVVDAYLSAVRQHDRPRAESLLCDGLRRGAAGRLTGLAQDWMEVVDWEITKVRDGERSAEVSAHVTVKLTGVATTVPFRFILTKEEGDWRICGFGSNGLDLNPQPTQ